MSRDISVALQEDPRDLGITMPKPANVTVVSFFPWLCTV